LEFVVELGTSSEQTEMVRAKVEAAAAPNHTTGLRDHDTLHLSCVRP
jgi:hypothetical protein